MREISLMNFRLCIKIPKGKIPKEKMSIQQANQKISPQCMQLHQDLQERRSRFRTTGAQDPWWQPEEDQEGSSASSSPEHTQ